MNSVFTKKALIVISLLVVLGIISVVVYKQSQEVPPVEVVEPKTEYKLLGQSVQGRKIEAFSFGNGDTHLAFVGGIHGGYEWNSVILAYEFIDYLTANLSLVPENLTVTIIPNANPDGVYKVVGKEGRFVASDIPSGVDESLGRFNANGVDLNRNFDCKWQPESMWRGQVVSAGTSAFSEPEAKVIRDFVLNTKPKAVVFWHSQANAVYASECENGILPETRAVMNVYSSASSYPPVDSFDAYAVTGDAEGWLASINIPAITVELTTHETIEWEKNLAGVKALFKYYSLQ